MGYGESTHYFIAYGVAYSTDRVASLYTQEIIGFMVAKTITLDRDPKWESLQKAMGTKLEFRHCSTP